ncbi:MAG: sigma-70 family RNA polymerase sigma factor [Candidatus Melainabacteria bacterium]|nr:sigma-70 family RNA polymerase sigma factor [Candidatus Melainabacteria bacterium]
MSALTSKLQYEDYTEQVEELDGASDNTVPFNKHAEDIEHMSNVRVFDKRKSHQPVKSYMDTIGTIKPLTVDQERELVAQAKNGDQRARNVLTLANLKLVASIAKRYEDRGLPMIDLLQEGSIGLMSAVNKFDPKMGHRFSTYAAWWIREAITRSLSNKSRIVRLPVHLNELMTKIRRVRSTLAVRYGRQATTEEIANDRSENIEKVEKALNSSQPCLSLDQKVATTDDEGCTLGETIMDHDSATPVDEADSHYVSSQIAGLLNSLNERERKVVKLRFGLVNGQEASLRDISQEMGLTRDQVGKISCLAMRKLKKLARRDEFEGYLA